MIPSVVGIDLGSANSLVAKVENGGVDILTNELNARSTPTLLALPSSERGARLFGASAESQLVTHPKSSVADVTSLLGAKCLNVQGHREASKLASSNNNVFLKLLYHGQEKMFLPEQLVGSFLNHLKRIVTDGVEHSVDQNNYYVLSAPNYFTDVERASLLDAARIAGLNVVQVVNDLTAAALTYGYFQKDLPRGVPGPQRRDREEVQDTRLSSPPLGERPRWVVFVDFGHAGLQAGLVALSADGLRVHATQTDRTVGGRDFDRRLAEYFTDAFNTKYKSRGIHLTPSGHPKVFSKLLTVAEKIKRQMSANKNVLPVVVECLADDLDLNTEMCRDTFERLCADLFDKVRRCLQLLIRRSGLSQEALHSVEVLGGSSRIPMFKSIVEEVFCVTPSTTLNADEAVAKGCALVCALNTKVFRVKPFYILETPHYSTQVKYGCVVPESGSAALVPASRRDPAHQMPSVFAQTKQVFVKNSASLEDAVTLELDELPHNNTVALEYCNVQDDHASPEEPVCSDLGVVLKRLVAIYNFDFDVAPSEGDRFRLQFEQTFGGIVRLRSALLVHPAKRVRYEDAQTRERQVKFTETRFGGLPEQTLQVLTDEEGKMHACDVQERLREETKNNLEEFTFSFRDELADLDPVVKQEEAWSIVVQYVQDVCSHFESDRYENSEVEYFRGQLEEVQKKKAVFMVWLQKFNKKLELESLKSRKR
jgi:molecular chaperone DnaK (HSP70)